MADEQTDTRVELGDKVVGEIEGKQIDVLPYVGKKSKIELVEEHEGEYGFYILVKTAVVDTLKDVKDDKGNPLQLRGSRIFSLASDDDGNIGWVKGGKLAEYLKEMKVEHYRDLPGKEVVLQSTTKKGGGRFLTFA